MRYQLAYGLNGLMRALGFKSIQSQFSLSFFLIIVLALGSASATYLTLSASADTVDMAGRQRMLSQRLAKEALLVSQGAETRATLQSTIDLFEQSHADLLEGNVERGIQPVQTEEIGRQLNKVEQSWGRYKSSIERFLGKPQPELLPDLQRQSMAVLSQMNDAVGMMTEAANAGVRTQQSLALGMTLGIVVLAVISRFLGLHWLMSQITLLRERLAKMAEGNFSQPIEQQASDNEVGQMFAAYNSVVEQVGELTRSIQQLSATITQQTDTLEQAAADSERSAEQQSTELEQAASAMNEMSTSVGEVARHANDAAAQAESAGTDIHQTHQVVKDSQTTFNDLNRVLADAVQVMQALDDDSQEIGKVLTVITGIAEQTNLLALNAAIEAARAGEQGRGFAVVADEVRTLAQRTQTSTEEIRRIIERLQTQSGRAVSAMATSTDTAKRSVGQIDQANRALENVVLSIEKIQEMGTLIATAAQQQSHVAAEIDQNITTISHVANDSSRTSGELRSSARLLQSDTRALGEQLAKLEI